MDKQLEDFKFVKRKDNSNKDCYHLQPYSQDFLKAKSKAFERYKRIYPVNDKENLYEKPKEPCIGYYVMKGYRPPLSQIKQGKKLNATMNQSSQKVIENIIKKYLSRKSQLLERQFEPFPILQQSINLKTESSVHRSSLNMKRIRPKIRVDTEYGFEGRFPLTKI